MDATDHFARFVALVAMSMGFSSWYKQDGQQIDAALAVGSLLAAFASLVVG